MRRRTSRMVCRASPRLRSRLHCRPEPCPAARCPRRSRLLPGLHRHRIRIARRAAGAHQGPGPASPRRHPGRVEAGSARPLPAPPDRHRHRARAAGCRVSQRRRGPRHTTPGGKLVFHLFGALAEFERDLSRERTQARLAAARARGRTGGRPTVMTTASSRSPGSCTPPASTPGPRSRPRSGSAALAIYRHLADRRSTNECRLDR
jgi:hypothetical protein